MGIICSLRRDVKDILLDRRIDDIIITNRLKAPELSEDDIRKSILPNDMKKVFVGKIIIVLSID